MVWAPEASTARTSKLELLRRLSTGPRGLTEAEAEARLISHGENVLPLRRPFSWPRRLARSLRDPFTMVLFGLGLVSLTVASWGTAAVIVVLVAASCVLRANGEYRADRSTAALRELVASTVTVRRRPSPDAEPSEREIPLDQLVPGDVIKLGPGDLVPADVRLLRSSGLSVHQAALTGESAPVPKLAPDRPDGEDHLCWQGSSVVAGSALAVVAATGTDTVLAGAYREERPTSAFDRSVSDLSWTLVRLTLIIPPIALVANALLHGDGLGALPFAVAVAVGLTPEMLPVVVTTALARGAALLARDGVIVKRLPALHDLGAADVLCLDKTGTLTRDRPVVDGSFAPDGQPDPEVLRWAAINSFWTLHLADLPAPDALDEAILDSVPDPGDVEGLRAWPFDPVTRVSRALVHDGASRVSVVKGAVEAVLERCAHVSPEAEQQAERTARRLADRGLRVLAVALRRDDATRDHVADGRDGAVRDHVADGRDDREAGRPDLTLAGYVTLTDELSPHAADALAQLSQHGCEPKVLTGDHPATAARICRDLGMPVVEVVDAGELSDAGLAEAANRATVFARCTPEHKARVVRALRRAGHTVGFLGDGVNDLPAMRAADVGICPRDAVDVTRETADIVLARKDLSVIGQAVAAGRRSTGNIVTYLRVALSSNLGNVVAMLVAGLMLPFLPMLPAQVLLQNLCFDAAQLAFAFDRPDPARMARPHRLRPRATLRFILGFGALNAAADLLTFTTLSWSVGTGQAAFHSGWFVENLLTQAAIMLLLRPRTAVPLPLWVATAALAAIGVFLPLSPLAAPLGLMALPFSTYLTLFALVIGYGLVLAALVRLTARRP
ncbi:magnesium-translocating P-type ATPase [Nonomuraea sp. NPDC050404]|uniref:magnesium-translocating P-type ATPase n=1 Tax=Nonomuraea sp. NPDC050404 TaxID=3155783 RepID=UPI00340E695C